MSKNDSCIEEEKYNHVLHERQYGSKTEYNNTLTFIEAESDHTFQGEIREQICCVFQQGKASSIIKHSCPQVLVKAKNKIFIRLSIIHWQV